MSERSALIGADGCPIIFKINGSKILQYLLTCPLHEVKSEGITSRFIASRKKSPLSSVRTHNNEKRNIKFCIAHYSVLT